VPIVDFAAIITTVFCSGRHAEGGDPHRVAEM
jgi:hypothetical protein